MPALTRTAVVAAVKGTAPMKAPAVTTVRGPRVTAAAAARGKPPVVPPIRNARSGWMSTPGKPTKDNDIWGSIAWGGWQKQQTST